MCILYSKPPFKKPHLTGGAGGQRVVSGLCYHAKNSCDNHQNRYTLLHTDTHSLTDSFHITYSIYLIYYLTIIITAKQEYNMLLNENTKLIAELDDEENSNKELQQKIKLLDIENYKLN